VPRFLDLAFPVPAAARPNVLLTVDEVAARRKFVTTDARNRTSEAAERRGKNSGTSACQAKVQAGENRAILPGVRQSPLSEFIPLAPDAIFWNNRLLRSPLGP
jgi:hypothetical protein